MPMCTFLSYSRRQGLLLAHLGLVLMLESAEKAMHEYLQHKCFESFPFIKAKHSILAASTPCPRNSQNGT